MSLKPQITPKAPRKVRNQDRSFKYPKENHPKTDQTARKGKRKRQYPSFRKSPYLKHVLNRKDMGKLRKSLKTEVKKFLPLLRYLPS
jgi:hypothetical protein